ncbi:MAG: hypothetical protein D6800_06730 [Candidatus Zixiibacteriota bacterium]|nr:MAG: hypothetical protein D6800_06730 [candidate division Zixibacteria bacterium]
MTPDQAQKELDRARRLADQLRLSFHSPGDIYRFRGDESYIVRWFRQSLARLGVRTTEGDDPIAAFARHELDRIRFTLEGILNSTAVERPEVIACCLLRAMRSATGLELSLEQYRIWLETLRSMLLLLKSGSSSGLIGITIEALSFDLSADLRRIADRILVAPVLTFLLSVDAFLFEISRRLQDAALRTRCGPLISMLGAFIYWLFGHVGSLTASARAFVIAVLAEAQRRFVRLSGQFGSRLDQDIGLAGYDTAWIDQILSAIDTLLSTSFMLELCFDGSAESAELPPDDSGRRGRRVPRDSDSGDGGDDGSGDDGSGGDTGGDRGGGQAGGGRARDSFVDPYTIVLTDQRIRAAVVSVFRADVPEDCSEFLSPQTRQALQQLGIV